MSAGFEAILGAFTGKTNHFCRQPIQSSDVMTNINFQSQASSTEKVRKWENGNTTGMIFMSSRGGKNK
jgi:hypothetical protein